MLVLTRKLNESIKIGNDIEVRIVSIRGDKVRLGVTAPDNVEIVRDDAVKKERINKKSGCCGKCSGDCKGGCHHG